MKNRAAIASITLAASLTGCSSMPLNHPDPKVGVPAEVGGIVGIVVGIPLDIVALPVTWPLAAKDDSPDGGGAYIIMAPSLATGYVVGNVVGSVPWLAFGWWGNEKYTKAQSQHGSLIETKESEQDESTVPENAAPSAPSSVR